VRHDELVAILAPLFSELSSRWQPVSSDVFAPAGQEVNLIEREMEQTLVCLGTRSLRYDHPDRHALFLLTTILGGGMSSRLFQEIREKKGLAYSVYSYIISHADSGALIVYAGTEKDHCREVIDIAQHEMTLFVTEEVPQDERRRTGAAEGKTLMSLESSDSLMTRQKRDLLRSSSPLKMFSPITTRSATICKGCRRSCSGANIWHLEVMGRLPIWGLLRYAGGLAIRTS
jgi:predicted Zn-dependent peptidase